MKIGIDSRVDVTFSRSESGHVKMKMKNERSRQKEGRRGEKAFPLTDLGKDGLFRFIGFGDDLSPVFWE